MRTLRQFAHVLRAFVHRLQQAAQPFGKRDITNAATQPPSLFEISLRESAHRTFLRWRSLFDFLRGADSEEQIRQRETSRILHAFFLRAGIAEIHLLHFAFKNLRQENCRIIAFANIAQHLCRLDLETPETFNAELLSTFCADGACR